MYCKLDKSEQKYFCENIRIKTNKFCIIMTRFMLFYVQTWEMKKISSVMCLMRNLMTKKSVSIEWRAKYMTSPINFICQGLSKRLVFSIQIFSGIETFQLVHVQIVQILNFRVSNCPQVHFDKTDK